MDMVVEIPGGPNPVAIGATNVFIGDAGVVAPSAPGVPAAAGLKASLESMPVAAAAQARTLVEAAEAGVPYCEKCQHVTDGLQPTEESEKQRTDPLQDEQREVNKTNKDTLASESFDRLSNNSPSEEVIVEDGWIIRIDNKQQMEPDDTVTLQSATVNYKSTIPARQASHFVDFMDFVFKPGPEGDYDVSVTVGGSSYMAWKRLRLPSDGQGTQPLGIKYDSDDELPDPYARDEAEASSSARITVRRDV